MLTCVAKSNYIYSSVEVVTLGHFMVRVYV